MGVEQNVSNLAKAEDWFQRALSGGDPAVAQVCALRGLAYMQQEVAEQTARLADEQHSSNLLAYLDLLGRPVNATGWSEELLRDVIAERGQIVPDLRERLGLQ